MRNEGSALGEFQLLVKAGAVQRRVIAALLMREVLTRYGRNNIGFLWLFVEPMLFTLVITALWSATRTIHGSNIPIVAFALTGYSSALVWRNMPGRCMRAVKPNMSLLFHRQVKIFDIYISRILLESIGGCASFVVLGLLFWSMDWMPAPEDAFQVLEGWLLLLWFGAALGMFIGSVAESVELVEKLWPPFSYILFPLSGAAFIVETLPERMREVVLYLPIIHAVEYLREGFFGSMFHPHYDLQYLVLWNLGLTLAALSQVRRVGRGRIDGDD